MNKNLKLTIVLCLLTIVNISAQEVNIAKAYYVKAREAYSEAKYTEVINYLEKVKEELGTSNPDILYLEVMTRFNIDKRDLQVSNLAEEFIKTANPADDRIQKVSLIAVEHREAIEEGIKLEVEAFNMASITMSLADLQNFKDKFPKSNKISEIDSMLTEKEELDYKLAKTKNQSRIFKDFLTNYPKSKYHNEIKDLMQKALEDEFFIDVKSENSVEKYDLYLMAYPTGNYSEEVSFFLEKSILEKANQEYQNSNFEDSKNFYSRYTKEFPSGSEINLANKRITEIEKKMSSNARIAGRTSAKYIMGTYSDFELYGLQLGRLSNNNVGTYFNIAVNENIGNMKFTTDESVSGSPDLFERASLSASFGLSYKIAYPIWIYAGVGYIYFEYYDSQDDVITTLSLNDFKNSFLYPELGIKLKLGNVAVLKAGGSYINSDLYINAGIGFQTKNW